MTHFYRPMREKKPRAKAPADKSPMLPLYAGGAAHRKRAKEIKVHSIEAQRINEARTAMAEALWTPVEQQTTTLRKQPPKARSAGILDRTATPGTTNDRPAPKP